MSHYGYTCSYHNYGMLVMSILVYEKKFSYSQSPYLLEFFGIQANAHYLKQLLNAWSLLLYTGYQ